MSIVASDLSYLTGQRIVVGKEWISREVIEGVPVWRARTYPSLHRSFPWRVISFLSFMCTSLWAGLRVERMDVVIGTTPPIFQAVSASLVAALRRKPFLLEVRDLWPAFAIELGVVRNRLLIGLARWLEWFLYRRADHVLVNSPAYRDYLVGMGISKEMITVIPNGVDVAMFDPKRTGLTTRDALGLEDKFVVTYAGAIGLANDIPCILRAAQRLQGEVGIHFLLIGDGKDRPHLEAAAREQKLANVTFLGARPKSQMHEYLAASNACVATLKNLAVFRTTYPNKVFDYMAAGRPTLLAIDGVIRAVMDEARGGVFVPPGDSDALAEAIRWLRAHPEEAQAMGRRARAHVERYFDRRRHAEQFLKLIEAVSSGGSRRPFRKRPAAACEVETQSIQQAERS